MRIEISKLLNSSSAIFHDEGAQVYNSLEVAFNRDEQVTLSFEGIKHCSTQFINACIGKLYLNYHKDRINTLLSIEGINENRMLALSVERVIDNALDAEKYSQILDEALADV